MRRVSGRPSHQPLYPGACFCWGSYGGVLGVGRELRSPTVPWHTYRCAYGGGPPLTVPLGASRPYGGEGVTCRRGRVSGVATILRARMVTLASCPPLYPGDALRHSYGGGAPHCTLEHSSYGGEGLAVPERALAFSRRQATAESQAALPSYGRDGNVREPRVPAVPWSCP